MKQNSPEPDDTTEKVIRLTNEVIEARKKREQQESEQSHSVPLNTNWFARLPPSIQVLVILFFSSGVGGISSSAITSGREPTVAEIRSVVETVVAQQMNLLRSDLDNQMTALRQSTDGRISSLQLQIQSNYELTKEHVAQMEKRVSSISERAEYGIRTADRALQENRRRNDAIELRIENLHDTRTETP